MKLFREYWKSLLWTDGYRFTGVAITLWLLVASVVMGGILAVFLAIGRVSSNKYIQFRSGCLPTIFRGYARCTCSCWCLLRDVYAGNRQRQRSVECVFPQRPELYGVGVTLNTCAYTTEILRGAIRSVAPGEIEAARAYGFSSVKLYRCIILPSALRIALPAYSNEVILMLHSTALAFTATVPDLLKIARDINSATYQPFTASALPRYCT